MSDCDVCIGGGQDYDVSPEFVDHRFRKARKVHRCEECRRVINIGDRYEYVSGVCDGFFTVKTCLICAEIRTAFCCGGWFGRLWDDVQEELLPQLTTGCLEKLETAAAKSLLLEKWRRWKGLLA